MNPARPTLPDLSPADCLEASLLRLPDGDFDKLIVSTLEEEPAATGHALIDNLERRFWSRESDVE